MVISESNKEPEKTGSRESSQEDTERTPEDTGRTPEDTERTTENTERGQRAKMAERRKPEVAKRKVEMTLDKLKDDLEIFKNGGCRSEALLRKLMTMMDVVSKDWEAFKQLVHKCQGIITVEK